MMTTRSTDSLLKGVRSRFGTTMQRRKTINKSKRGATKKRNSRQRISL